MAITKAVNQEPANAEAINQQGSETMRSILDVVLIAAAASLTIVTAAVAQDYPSKPVSIVVPFPAGGNTDAAIRLLTPSLAEQLGQKFVVENKPGAGTLIGAMAVATAAPDGYTLLTSGASTNIAPLFNTSTPFKPEDLTFLALTYQTPYVLLVRPDFPAKTMAEFLAYAKENPNSIKWATQGYGSLQHIVSERFFRAADVKVKLVPYTGSAPAAVDVIAGHVDATMDSGGAIMDYVRSGKMRALAITNEARVPQLPDLPTFKETGVDIAPQAWVGVFAPRGTPADVLDKLNKAINVAIDSKAFQNWVTTAGGNIKKISAAEAQAMFEHERVLAQETVKLLPPKE